MDSSVLLAAILIEQNEPSQDFWKQPLVSSRLAEYEVWCRLHALRRGAQEGDRADALLRDLTLVELTRQALGRMLDPLPLPVRTLDAIHLATMDFLRREGETKLLLATYDRRLEQAARAMGFGMAGLNPVG